MLKKITIFGISIILILSAIGYFVTAGASDPDIFDSGSVTRGTRAQPTANFTYLIADGTNFIGSTAFRVDDGDLDIFIEAFPATGCDWDPASVTKADIIIQEYHGHVTHYDADTVAMVVNNTGATVVGNTQVRNDLIARGISPSQVVELAPIIGGSATNTVKGVKITSYGMVHTQMTTTQVDTFLVELPNGIKFFHGTCASSSSATSYMVGNPAFYGLQMMILDYEHDFNSIDTTFSPDVMAKVHDFNNNGLGTLWDDYPGGQQTLNHNSTYNYVLPEPEPELSEALLIPGVGTNETDFEFSVKYKYLGNLAPTKNQVIIDGTGYDMVAQASSGWDIGVEFVYDTKLPGGSHQHHFEFEVDAKSIRLPDPGYEISGPEINSIPYLSTGGHSPQNGDDDTEFTFSIKYIDADNDVPTMSRLVLDGYNKVMTSQDSVYDTWSTFTYKTTLDIGTHDYYFLFNDGQIEIRYPTTGTINGPNIVRSNEAPTLTLVSVEPEVGHRNTEFQFYVTYTDADDDAPSSTNIIVDGTEYSMTPSSTFYSDGVIYFYSTFLSLGMHEHHFEFNDSRVEVRAPLVPGDVYDGPEVKNRAPIPVLNEPSEGNVFNNEDIIKFDASSSSDPDGDPITIEIYSDLDGFLGSDLTVSTNLSAGDHTITLTVEDNLDASSSLTVNITVIQLVPNLSNIEITITPEEPVEGETITVKAAITNSGDAPAVDVEVKISVDDVTVFEDTISQIKDMNFKSIETTITATEGDHILKVAIVDGLENTLEYSVETRPEPSAFAGEDITVYVNEKASFDGSESNSSGRIDSYFWDFGDDSNNTGISVSHIYKNKGKYSVKLTVTDELGKQDSDMLTVTVLAKESSGSEDFEMDSSYIAIIVVVIVIVILLALIMIKRKKKTDDADDYFTGQTAGPQQQIPPPPQAQLGYISPPPDAAMQQDLQTIAPPQDLILEQPEDDYYHPRHEHYTAAPDAESLYGDAPPQPVQDNELPEEDLASLLPDNISEDTTPQVQPETISQEPIESPPQPTVAPQPTVKVSGKVPKIVKKNDTN